MNFNKWVVTKLNEYHSVFRGNFVLNISRTQSGDAFVFENVNTNKLELERIPFVPVALNQDSPTPDVSDKEQYEYIKSYVVPIKVENGFEFDESNQTYRALMDFSKDYTGESVVIEDKKVALKIVEPTRLALTKESGSWYAIFIIDVYMTVIGEYGYLANEDEFYIKRSTDETWHKIKHVSFDLSSGAQTEPIGDVRTSERTKNIMIRNALKIELVWNYESHELEDELYDAMMGNVDHDKVYQIRKTFNEDEWLYNVKIEGSGYTSRKGIRKRIDLSFKEV